MSEREVGATVQAEDVGARADVVLGRRIPGLSRRVARRLALDGGLRIDGRHAKPSERVSLGQRLSLSLPERAPGPETVRVLEVTDRFVYVDKPAGLHTVALTPGEAGCLSVWVAAAHPECAQASLDPREGGAVHRLDRETSGVVAFARSRETWTRARAAFEAGEVGKRYLAVCRGGPDFPWPPSAPADALPGWLDEVTPLSDPVLLPELAVGDQTSGPALRIRAPIGRGPERGRMAIRLDGQGATTLVQLRARRPGPTVGLVCELELLTGRRHQARVHLAWAGLAVRGDALYGETPPEAEPERLRLHAVRLDLTASFTGERPVTAPASDGLFDA